MAKKTTAQNIKTIKHQASIGGCPVREIYAHDNGDFVVVLVPQVSLQFTDAAKFLNKTTTGLDWYWVGKSLRVHVIGTPNNVNRDNVRA
jgi:hypothetical protein